VIIGPLKLFPTERCPQGIISGLAQALQIRHSTISAIINGYHREIVKLLDILNQPYNTLTSCIRSVGGGGANTEALVNPKFPIELYNPRSRGGGNLIEFTRKWQEKRATQEEMWPDSHVQDLRYNEKC
jgi:hypothetical protein